MLLVGCEAELPTSWTDFGVSHIMYGWSYSNANGLFWYRYRYKNRVVAILSANDTNSENFLVGLVTNRSIHDMNGTYRLTPHSRHQKMCDGDECYVVIDKNAAYCKVCAEFIRRLQLKEASLQKYIKKEPFDSLNLE